MERLEMINVVSVPHLKQADIKKMIKNYQKLLGDEVKIDNDMIKKERKELLKKLKGKVL